MKFFLMIALILPNILFGESKIIKDNTEALVQKSKQTRKKIIS